MPSLLRLLLPILILFLFYSHNHCRAETSPVDKLDKQKSFATGQQMAECAAFFEFLSKISNGSDVQLFHDKANGWQMAAMPLIVTGSFGDQQLHSRETIGYIMETKINEFVARAENGGAEEFKNIDAEFKRNCMPLVPLQIKIVEGFRRGDFSAK